MATEPEEVDTTTTTEEPASILDYGSFKTEYQNGYGLDTSSMITDAYRIYRLEGTLPTATPSATTTTTETTEEATAEETTVGDYVTPDYGRVEEPEFGDVDLPGVEVGEVTAGKITVEAAPAYEVSAAQQAWEEAHGGRITDILEQGGIGIDEDTQQLMRQKVYDDLKGREKESIRVMERDLEQRGVYNSNLYFAEKQKIRATTTRGLASASTDIKIQSAFIKMASFENALGLSATFLDYLGRQSELAYAPKLATWQAQETAKIATFQAKEAAKLATYNAQISAKLNSYAAKVDVYKTQLNQAYTQNNAAWSAEVAADVAYQLQQDKIDIAEMEMEYAQAALEAEASGAIAGSFITGLFAVIAAIFGL